MDEQKWQEQLEKSKSATDKLNKMARRIMFGSIFITVIAVGALATYIFTDKTRQPDPHTELTVDVPSTSKPTITVDPTKTPVPTITATPTEVPVTKTPKEDPDVIKEEFPNVVTSGNFVELQSSDANNSSPSAIKSGVRTTMLYTELKSDKSQNIALIDTKTVDDVTYSTSPQVVISTDDVDKAKHLDGPTIVKGKFEYEKQYYTYLLAFSSIPHVNMQDASIRIALSTDMVTWVVVPSSIFELTRSRSATNDHLYQGGLTQPSIINLNKESEIAFLSTHDDGSNASVVLDIFDLSNVAKPHRVTERATVTNDGIIRQNDTNDFLESADFVINDNTLIVATSTHTNQRVSAVKTPVTSSVYSLAIENADLMGSIKNGKWRKLGDVTPDSSGFDVNYNPCFIRDEYGFTDDLTTLLTITGKNDNGKNELVNTNFVHTKTETKSEPK